MSNTKELEKKIKAKYSLNEAFSTSPSSEGTPEEAHPSLQTEVQPVLLQNSNTESDSTYSPSLEKMVVTQQQTIQPTQPRKMTLYVTEGLHKAFNDIYAMRLLKGRYTEKSSLICEAITLLVEKEKKDGYYLGEK